MRLISNSQLFKEKTSEFYDIVDAVIDNKLYDEITERLSPIRSVVWIEFLANMWTNVRATTLLTNVNK